MTAKAISLLIQQYKTRITDAVLCPRFAPSDGLQTPKQVNRGRIYPPAGEGLFVSPPGRGDLILKIKGEHMRHYNRCTKCKVFISDYETENKRLQDEPYCSHCFGDEYFRLKRLEKIKAEEQKQGFQLKLF